MEKPDGYYGVWFTLGQYSGRYGDKYSGGLGTYTAKHVPMAQYAPEADATFFVYGGALPDDRRHLLAMVSRFDHRRGTVPRPTIVHDKEGVEDPHDNPSIALDDDGYVWVFVSGRGRKRSGFIYKSEQPYDIERFELMHEGEFTYPQPWWISGNGFLHLYTRYTGVRELYWNTTEDGRVFGSEGKLAGMGGHYQVSCRYGDRVITAFNLHPLGNVDVRTNLYVVQTADMGRTWTTMDGTEVATPITDVHSPALVRDFMVERRLVYMKDIAVDGDGNPVVLVVTSADHRAGPGGAPRIWTTAHWTGDEWRLRGSIESTHNYDMGSLYVEEDGTWRIIGPTDPGPQKFGTGGEMVLWRSSDQGQTWERVRSITENSPRNHAYARRPVDAHPEFYAFWADGNAFAESESRLYFTNREGDSVRRLPVHMTQDEAEPEPSPGLGPGCGPVVEGG